MDGRQQRGIQIAEKGGIEEGMKGWIVPSQYGNKIYLVKQGGGGSCTCPDCQLGGTKKCKHMWAVQYWVQKKTNADGSTRVTKIQRTTYPQNWTAYNQSQTQEITLFDQLLRDLVENIGEPEQKTGRPRLSLRESVFCGIQKVYSGLSSRRAYTLYKNASEREQLTKAPNFNAVNKLLAKEELTPILQNLLALSALPLKSVESGFAIDSSGFRTTQFTQYCIEKHGVRRYHTWVKANILVGVKTNVIVGARITKENAGDSLQFEPLLTEAHGNGFNLAEVYADKGYTSRENYNLANELGATAYIPFHSTHTGKSRGSLTWTKMFHYFNLHRDEFLQHYHKRSNVETVFKMVKAKFGDTLKSKKTTSQTNELLCKLIAHNICVVIQEMHGLGINPLFTAG